MGGGGEPWRPGPRGGWLRLCDCAPLRLRRHGGPPSLAPPYCLGAAPGACALGGGTAGGGVGKAGHRAILSGRAAGPRGEPATTPSYPIRARWGVAPLTFGADPARFARRYPCGYKRRHGQRLARQPPIRGPLGPAKGPIRHPGGPACAAGAHLRARAGPIGGPAWAGAGGGEPWGRWPRWAPRGPGGERLALARLARWGPGPRAGAPSRASCGPVAPVVGGACGPARRWRVARWGRLGARAVAAPGAAPLASPARGARWPPRWGPPRGRRCPVAGVARRPRGPSRPDCGCAAARAIPPARRRRPRGAPAPAPPRARPVAPLAPARPGHARHRARARPCPPCPAVAPLARPPRQRPHAAHTRR